MYFLFAMAHPVSCCLFQQHNNTTWHTWTHIYTSHWQYYSSSLLHFFHPSWQAGWPRPFPSDTVLLHCTPTPYTPLFMYIHIVRVHSLLEFAQAVNAHVVDAQAVHSRAVHATRERKKLKCQALGVNSSFLSSLKHSLQHLCHITSQLTLTLKLCRKYNWKSSCVEKKDGTACSIQMVILFLQITVHY